MTTNEAKNIVDKIVKQVFGVTNPLSLDQFMQKFAFDIKLPQPVDDVYDNSTTWTQSTNPVRFSSLDNIAKNKIGDIQGLRPKKDLKTIDDIIGAWNEINLMATEKYQNSVNVAKSDNIYDSENVYRSLDIRGCKNIVFSNGMSDCEYIAASQRINGTTFCIRAEDSNFCSNCFNISFSRKLTNCLFMHDTGDMQDSMFCNNISSKRFCIANMQYTEQEYRKIFKIVAEWILNN